MAQRFLENFWVPALVREAYPQLKVYLKMKTGGGGGGSSSSGNSSGGVCLTEAFRL